MRSCSCWSIEIRAMSRCNPQQQQRQPIVPDTTCFSRGHDTNHQYLRIAHPHWSLSKIVQDGVPFCVSHARLTQCPCTMDARGGGRRACVHLMFRVSDIINRVCSKSTTPPLARQHNHRPPFHPQKQLHPPQSVEESSLACGTDRLTLLTHQPHVPPHTLRDSHLWPKWNPV